MGPLQDTAPAPFMVSEPPFREIDRPAPASLTPVLPEMSETLNLPAPAATEKGVATPAPKVMPFAALRVSRPELAVVLAPPFHTSASLILIVPGLPVETRLTLEPSSRL